tara:strand:+ start:616 stop:831 length:216 start_codon:yes stop_codon:yes gene_type:complete
MGDYEEKIIEKLEEVRAEVEDTDTGALGCYGLIALTLLTSASISSCYYLGEISDSLKNESHIERMVEPEIK